jgi:hypothetical protein
MRATGRTIRLGETLFSPENYGGLNRRSQPGRNPLHRVGHGYDLIDVIANDALKRARLESDPRRLDMGQGHWT